ncbi:PREDICTED: putative DNA glycosylase At3g47830 isoform X1 [Nicotiana attenuata]|uniref:Dna glycosylase n=1 Tax=Nicotiana attenuata TaxID=49451 RepID=A0A314KIQ3_NICAT|nr:PREDICTED: putative DNA glycosylase At3g47830 isoform X1 [Nicotiana attenuata]OIT29197.1 putative dna glycosylase [Nicotiana attenuata]
MTKLTKAQKSRKRKNSEDQCSPCSSSKSSKTVKVSTASSNGSEPFPNFPRPTPEECRTVRDNLLAFHGFPKEFIKYRKQRSVNHDNGIGDENDDISVTESCKESVLDGLISTILSQNTTEANSQKAFASLKSSFPTWESVLAADAKLVEDAIRCGGLAPTKTSCIKGILSSLFQKKGNLCLEYLRELSIEEIKKELSCFRGIGPKTVACVLMFHLQRDDFPVDTHIFQIAKTLRWVPAAADVKKTYLHLNRRIPDELKFDINCLIYTHGKVCRECSRKGSDKPKKEHCDKLCPLLCQSSNAI